MGGRGRGLWTACFNTILLPAHQDMGLGDGGAAGKSPPQPRLMRGCDGCSCTVRLPWGEPDSILSLEASWSGLEDKQRWKGEHRQERGDSYFPFSQGRFPGPSLLQQENPPRWDPCCFSLQPDTSHHHFGPSKFTFSTACSMTSSFFFF